MRESYPISEISKGRSSAPSAITQFGPWIVAVGIALYTVFSVLLDHAMRGSVDNPAFPDQSLLNIQLPPAEKAIGYAGMVIILLAGVLYMTAPASVRLGKHFKYLLYAWIGYTVVLALRNFQPRDFLTSAVYSPIAPGCALASCLLFATADRNNWRALVRIVAYGGLAVSIIAFFEMAIMRAGSRGEAFWRIDTYAKILEVSAIVSFGWFAKTRRAWLGAIPLVALVAATIAMQTRLMVVELISLLAFYRLFSQRRLSANTVVALCLCGLVMVGAFYFVWYSPATVRGVLPASATAFLDRSTEDTRSGQFVNFFAKVPSSTFLLGVGIPRQGEFNSLGAQGIDLGYVNILYIGGVPALLLYFAIHLLPAVRSMGHRFDSVDAACMASVMTYGVRLFSSTIPSFYPGYFIVLLLMGHCAVLAREHRRPYRQVRPGYPAKRFETNREAVAFAGKQ